MHDLDALFDLGFVCTVLDTTAEQLENMCTVFGIKPLCQNGENVLEGEAVRRLYRFLYPPYVPPEA